MDKNCVQIVYMYFFYLLLNQIVAHYSKKERHENIIIINQYKLKINFVQSKGFRNVFYYYCYEIRNSYMEIEKPFSRIIFELLCHFRRYLNKCL